jgi:DNA-binding NtrC family response regulator
MPEDKRIIKVLAVDDEENIIRAYQSCFEQYEDEGNIEFDLTVVNNAEAAIKEIVSSKKDNNPFKVAFIDIRMPKHDGVWTAREIRKLNSKLQIVIVTAFSDILPSEISKQVPPRSRLLYTQKPFHMHEIQHLAIALSEKWDLEERMRTSNMRLEADLESTTFEANQAQKQLKDSGRSLTERLTNTHAGAIIVNKNNEIIASNPHILSMLGYSSQDELIKRKATEVIEDAHSCFRKDKTSIAVIINKTEIVLQGETAELINIFNDNLFQ